MMSRISWYARLRVREYMHTCEVAYTFLQIYLETYFMPRQFLGPVEKGCSTFFLSFAKRGSKSAESGASQRSGTKLSLSVKL